MYKASLKNILTRKEECTMNLSLIPQVGDTLQLREPNKFLLVHGITHIIENESIEFEIFVEPIDRTYWMNEI
ncbi:MULTISPECIES: hypothetical protein [Enterococcus]|uniref:Uncharacterized protein n=1 Tax=Enterococcus malodoratus ATCC 43197 TaxID=1158601 RepID=R2QWI8_9ENTE|nr:MULTISPECIES: hypothetical protein [Enterococcus]EOH75815.1 hypothetical protein UAI_02825 [Enterococcus malodoratus ATCC 43197]EOT66484.1 hypothetical protein I585_02005 [Enterococcus malodoratus ATCC 43197]OJG64673.1 hypothetical protein RV07_GL004049 [Enterococcus malodoratus]SET58147.1 hypothetical protein SAMN04487821_11563 [Enterococcus malodoratus]SPW90485.1 Uncharacterised protein [Enterococcus malodoratus]